MKQLCEHCKKETEGYKMTVNGDPMFVCMECKQKSKYVPFVHPNFNEKYSGIVCPDFPGSHNFDYGR